MTISHNQAIMVLHQEGTTTSMVPQTNSCSLFVLVNQLNPGGGGQEQTLYASAEASPLAKPTSGSRVANSKTVSSMSLSAMATTNTSSQLCNLPPESTCKGITVTLDNNNMWNEFFRCQTEMILTKQGRRMFPCCRFRISGLEPFQRYNLVMDIQPVDNFRYKWSDRRWETNGKADPHTLRSFIHPDSPASGLDWMQNPVSFYKLKLTNNALDQEGHVILNSMHRYIPCLHIVPADKAVDVIQLDTPDVATFSFSQTEFFAVTAYQNLSITQLKIDYNPFATGFRDDASNSRCGKLKSTTSTDKVEIEVKSSKEATTLNNLKSLFAKRNASEKITTNGNQKTIDCVGPRKVEPEHIGNCKKRQLPGGLSEQIKGVQVKRINLEKIHDDNNQQKNADGPASEESSMNMAYVDCTSEDISNNDSATVENKFSANNTHSTLNKTASNKSSNENPALKLCKTEIRTGKLISEQTLNVVEHLDSAEVKKKRAEPVPLPLLALFLQQLKSKTRPTRAASKSEASSLTSQSEKSCPDTSVAKNSSSTSSFNPSPNTLLNVQSATSPKSQTFTSSVLAYAVAKSEQDTVSTLCSDSGAASASNTNDINNGLQLSTPESVATMIPVTAHDGKTNTSHSETTLDTKIDPVNMGDASSKCVVSYDHKVSQVTTPDVPINEVDKSSTEPSDHFCGVPCPNSVTEVVPQSPTPWVTSSPSYIPSSPYMSPPSSPDPFPPSMFSVRPIPQRKALDPFPAFDRPRPLLVPAVSLPHSIIKPTSPRNSSPEFKVNCPVVFPEPFIPKEIKRLQKTSKGIESKVKPKQCGNLKLIEGTEAMEGSIPVPMQPNLEDVEGQLFVSFMSKKALEIHLGDKEDILKKTTENTTGEVHDEKESIDALEKVLLRDLKTMKYRQVIHPILQAVGLKLNLLDVTLSIDLQYLGVSLPIPPPILSPEESTETCSSQVHFVSRTGKTTDITKIKGWREKFSTTSSSSVPGVTTSSDTGQKNLSAFCSDMLDEYLENEGKLIDERAASFSQSVVSPVAYQLPTKSTSYVRTLDSVLKKQTLPLATTLSISESIPITTALTAKGKKAGSGEKIKKSIKSTAKRRVSSTDMKSGENSLKKPIKSDASKSAVPSADCGLSESKKAPKINTKKGLKGTKNSLETAKKPVKSIVSVATAGKAESTTPGLNLPIGRSPCLPKTFVKLRDIEDGAVWEGRNRTHITEERAAIALSSLVTAEGTIGGSPSTIIKRRAPPCLNIFCRLGCVCASLVQQKHQNHCGKPRCMLGCDCLRRKVVLLKNENTDMGSAPLSPTEENYTKMKRKKTRITYILSGPGAAPEPAIHVKKLWVHQNDSDPEQLCIPDTARPLHAQPISQSLQKDSTTHPSPKHAAGRDMDMEVLRTVKRQESQDCARVQPFCWKKRSLCRQSHMKEGHPDHGPQKLLQEIEEGELRPSLKSGPSKRLEIVSKCKWETEGSRNFVLRTVCERMAQDRLKDIFWIGKYQIQPISKTTNDTDDGTVITHKVVISKMEKNEEKIKEEKLKQLEAQLIEKIGKSEVKGLPLLSRVTPAGLLMAEKKPSGALGQIMVNGKLYPQAKLELGQMGALHPANRLAAYITGRVCVANKLDSEAVTTNTKASHTVSATPSSVVTTVASTLFSPVTLNRPTVSQQPVTTEMSKDEISCVNSLQQKTNSTCTLSVQNIINKVTKSSFSGLSGSTVNSVLHNMPPKYSICYISAPTISITDGSNQVAKAVPGSSSQKTVVLNTSDSSLPFCGSKIKLMQPRISTPPVVPGQKLVVIKKANLQGQVIHLVQFKALNPNIIINPQQSSFIKPVSLTKPQTSMTAPHSVATLDMNMAPVQSTTTGTVTSSTSPIATKINTPLPSSKTLLFCSKPGTLKIIPGNVKNMATNTFRTVPPKLFEEPKMFKDPGNPSSVSSAQSTSEGLSANQGLQLTSKSCLSPKYQETQKLDNPTHPSSTPNKEESQCSKISQENVIFADHSYTFEMKRISTPDKKEGSDLADDEVDSNCTELTEDSDMYEDADSVQPNEKQALFVDNVSDPGKKYKKNQYSVALQLQTLSDEDDDEMVDVETYEEDAEKSPVPPELYDTFQNQSSDEENDNENVTKLKRRRRMDEKNRRSTMTKCFHNLQQTLNIEDPKAPRIRILSEALKEIHFLNKQRDQLNKMQNVLRKKRAYYLQMASQLSGISKSSIFEKILGNITSKQKSLFKRKANATIYKIKNKLSKHLKRMMKSKQKKISTKVKVKPLSIHNQKHLGFQERGTENGCTNQKMTVAQHGLQTKPPVSDPTPHLSKCSPSIPVPHERTKTNIPSLNKSQTLDTNQVLAQVIPVPYNDIVTVSNHVQPVDITSLRKSQSTTPGVAAVSIYIPPISHPRNVQKPFPILEQQVPKLANDPLNPSAAVHKTSLPTISTIASLVLSEKPQITSPDIAVMQTEVQKNHSSKKATIVEEEKHLVTQLPVVVPINLKHSERVNIEGPKQEEDEKNACKLDGDEHLMSLLDELVFLNPKSEPQEAAPSFTEQDALNLLTNKDADMDRDDDRSLSPLFLKLDEDFISSPSSKDVEIEDIPPKVDDLVNVIFGSESPPNSSESEFITAAGDDCTRFSLCPGNRDAPTPPPLLQMKTDGSTTADSPKEQANLSWRPMPKLAPLGLKTQETGHSKFIISYAPKLDLKQPSLHNTHV